MKPWIRWKIDINVNLGSILLHPHNGQDVRYQTQAISFQVSINRRCIVLEGNGQVRGRGVWVAIEVSHCQQVSAVLCGGMDGLRTIVPGTTVLFRIFWCFEDFVCNKIWLSNGKSCVDDVSLSMREKRMFAETTAAILFCHSRTQPRDQKSLNLRGSVDSLPVFLADSTNLATVPAVLPLEEALQLEWIYHSSTGGFPTLNVLFSLKPCEEHSHSRLFTVFSRPCFVHTCQNHGSLYISVQRCLGWAWLFFPLSWWRCFIFCASHCAKPFLLHGSACLWFILSFTKEHQEGR